VEMKENVETTISAVPAKRRSIIAFLLPCTPLLIRNGARPLVAARTTLVSDEFRKEIRQHAEQCQSGYTVRGENPCATAFMMLFMGH
jgi:hypothetical protein